MQTFKDRTGKTWTIELSIGCVERVRAQSPFDLYEPGEPGKDQPDSQKPLQQRLMESWGDFWELLWHLVEPQASAQGVTPEQFGEAMASQCLVSAWRAFWLEWSDFFRGLGEPLIARALEMAAQTAEATAMKAVQKMEDPRLAELQEAMVRTAEAELDQILDQAIRRPATSRSSGKPPDGSESIPAPSPGVS